MATDKNLDVITHKQKLTTYENYKAVPCTQLKRKRTALFVGSSVLLLLSAIILIWLNRKKQKTFELNANSIGKNPHINKYSKPKLKCTLSN